MFFPSLSFCLEFVRERERERENPKKQLYIDRQNNGHITGDDLCDHLHVVSPAVVINVRYGEPAKHTCWRKGTHELVRQNMACAGCGKMLGHLYTEKGRCVIQTRWTVMMPCARLRLKPKL